MKTVIEMAREAGWKDLRDYDSQMQHDFFMGNTDSLKRLVDLARADEREACAKVCEQTDKEFEGPDQWDWHSKDYAAAIRARAKP